MNKRFLYSILFLLAFCNAMAQRVGIGTADPRARLHVADSSVVFTGPQPLPFSPRDPTIPREGNRMFWYADKAALLVGGIGPWTEWNKNDVGAYSFATGYDIKAVANYSSAFGESTKANGNFSIAMGRGTQANGLASLVIGLYNDTLVVPDRDIFSYPTTPLFIVGNGFNPSARSNALVVYKSGNTTISGYTQLGKTTEGAPVIKMKKFTGTSSPSQNGFTDITHGLSRAKIIGVQVIMKLPGFVDLGPGSRVNSGYEYEFQILDSIIRIANLNGNSANILSKNFVVLVTYEE